jgi:amino acid transporter
LIWDLLQEADRRDDNRYTMVILFPILYLGWKLIHRTKIYKPHEVDLSKNLEEIDEYERNFVPQKAGYVDITHTSHLHPTNESDFRTWFERVLDKLFG